MQFTKDGPQEVDTNKSGGSRYSQGKPGGWWYAPIYGLRLIAPVWEQGAEKYAPMDWREGQDYSILVDCAMRHMLEVRDKGVWAKDPDSGCLHLAHAAWNVLGLLTFMALGRDQELNDIDRWRGGTARFLYGDFFTFQPQFKLVLVGNHKPQLRNVDDAIRRRLHLVPFTHKPVQPDPDLPEKLRAEAGAILAWMIEGCLAWQSEGIAPPPSVADATTECFEDEDALGSWIAERCELSPTAFATTAALFDDWRQWCGGLGEDAGSEKRFSQLLKNRGLAKGREPKSRRMGFHGITLLPPEYDLDDLRRNVAAASTSPEVGRR